MHVNAGEFPINPHNPPFGSKFFPWNTIDIGLSLAMFDYGRAAELSRKLVCARAMLIMWTVGEPCHSFDQDGRTTHRDLVGVLMVSLSPGYGWIGDAGWTTGTTRSQLSLDKMVLLALHPAIGWAIPLLVHHEAPRRCFSRLPCNLRRRFPVDIGPTMGPMAFWWKNTMGYTEFQWRLLGSLSSGWFLSC